jgi:hypothetical protein
MKFTVVSLLALLSTISPSFADEPRKGGKGSKVLNDLTGFYRGQDLDDGSLQALSIYCENGICQVVLTDASFGFCNGMNGLGLATDVTDLGDFGINLYCAPSAGADVDVAGPVTRVLVGNLVDLGDGILFRTSNGYTYYKVSNE